MKPRIPVLVTGVLGLCTAISFGWQVGESRPASDQNAEQQTNPSEAIDFDRARELLRKRQRGEKLTASEETYLQKAREARRRGEEGKRPAAFTPREKTGLKPLTEMLGQDQYKSQDGGLYGRGKNTPPDDHFAAALAQARKIQPLNSEGRPDRDGRVVLVSLSMSNATQEFSVFKRLADSDPGKSKLLTIVDCAQGGQAMAEWKSPEAMPWREAARRIATAGVTPQQVQVAWIKLANKGPSGDLESHGKKLQQDTLAVIQNAKAKFPQLRLVYLGSRIYGGYATGALNPEPYAYESAFPVRWLIQDQMRGDPELNYDETRGTVKAPLLLWGPYLWGDGVVPRHSDQLAWTRDDFAGDGVHPSPSGREKVARLLLDFFRTDATAKPWFVE